jgi:hypothetical protein
MKRAILALVMSCILFVGCNTPTVSNLVTALNVLVGSAQAAEVIATGLVAVNAISIGDAALVGVYASGIATAAQNSITELNSTDTAVVKIENITKQFAVVTKPVFGPTTSAEVTLAINVISVAVNSFLAQLNSPGVVSLAKLADKTETSVVLAPGDQKVLKQIQKTCTTIIKNAAVLQGK